MSTAEYRRTGLALIAFAILVVPPVRRAMQSSMTAQMLLDIPLLAACGWLLAAAVPRPVCRVLHSWNRGGVSGLLLASSTAALWMLPRALDAAVNDPWAEAAKLLSVPLLIGLPLGLSWPRMGFVVRGVLLAELIASCFRLGWLYQISPVRLCNSFLLDDQQRLGTGLLIAGSFAFLYLAGKLLWGKFTSTGIAFEAGPDSPVGHEPDQGRGDMDRRAPRKPVLPSARGLRTSNRYDRTTDILARRRTRRR